MINYLYDCYCILNKVYSDRTFLKQAISSTNIEEKNRALTIKTVYGVLDNDIRLTYYIKKLTNKSPKLVIRTVLKVSMYAIELNKPVYAVTKNAVELVKKLGKGGTAGFINAFLRKFSTTKIDFPTDRISYLSIKYSYPEFMVKKILADYDDFTEEILSSENKKTCVVFNNIDGQKYLIDNKIDYSLTPFDNVFFTTNFVRNSDFDKGLYTFQSLGSVAICDIVDNGNILLDCCAAPGGKSIRLSKKFNHIVDFELHEHRCGLIEDYKKRMGVDNITVKNIDSKVFIKDYENYFDAVLCDAPCSGSGVINDNPDIKLNREESSILEMNLEQKSILNNVSKYVKVGGYLYYSTCSIFSCENIDIINDFLNNKKFIIEKIDSKVPHKDINGTIQFLPNISYGSGFYVAKLKRIL